METHFKWTVICGGLCGVVRIVFYIGHTLKPCHQLTQYIWTPMVQLKSLTKRDIIYEDTDKLVKISNLTDFIPVYQRLSSCWRHKFGQIRGIPSGSMLNELYWVDVVDPPSRAAGWLKIPVEIVGKTITRKIHSILAKQMDENIKKKMYSPIISTSWN